jgi:hypothetical protein
MMNDATLLWGGDIVVGPTGDIALASGGTLGQQRVLRRLLTNENDYVWNPRYGAGLGQFVGAVINERQIVGVIKSQIFAEATVARQPDPTVAAEAFSDGSVYLEINYVDALDGNTQSLTFTVGN